MKEGWSNCKIGDICSITDFVSNGSFASLKENVKYYNSPNYAVLVRLADASNSFDRSKFVYTDEHGYDFSKKSHLHGGELIMSNVGSVGSMFICPVMKQPMTLAPNTISITSQNNRFLYYYFLSDGFKAKLKGITSSTTLKKFNKTNFKLLEICIPPLSEQLSIVDYLDSAFAKIDAMKANVEKALNEAKALFQASLNEMFEPKEGWLHKKLGEVCNVIGGGTPDTKNKEYWGGNIPWATVSDMNCDVLKSTGDYITDKGLNNSSSRIIKKGEIIIATRVGLGKVCKLAVDTAINQDLKGIIPKDNNIFKDFIFYYFKHKAKYIIDNGIGATVKGVKIKFIEGLSFDFPSFSEQQSIANTLDSLKSKVDRLQANFDKISQECDALKQAILRQVFE